MTTSASSRRTLMDRLLRLLPAPQPDADFTPPPQELAPDVWALDRQQRWPGGARLPLRTTIVRVRSGGLVVISPPPLFGSGACAEIDSIGVVEQVVAPNTFHYVYAAQFLSQYPRATFLVSPALPERVEGLPPAVELGPTAPESWSGVLEIEVLGPVRGVSEVVFFHVPTGSVILTDLAFNITYSGRRIDRLMWQMAGIPDGFGPGRTSRTVLLRDRSEAARCLRRVADWPIRQIIVAHGDVVAHNAKDRFVNAFALYLGAQ